jgi:hypothetical protein
MEQASSSSTGPICKSCGLQGHSTAASHICPNHQFTLKERLSMAFPESYQRFTISLTLKSFLKINKQEEPADKLEQFQRRVIELSTFLRQVVYRAQIFVSYYILSNANSVGNLTNDIFDKIFWYRICRVVYGKITIQQLQNLYPRLRGIQAAFNRLQSMDDVNLLVELNDLVGYGQILSTACETIATSSNNFYVENFEHYLANYFIYKLQAEYNVRNSN